MKQKRVYELEGAKVHARFEELPHSAAGGIVSLCADVCTASDRALPVVKAKLDGYLAAYCNLERNRLFSIVGRRAECTVVAISDLQGTILIVKSRRKENDDAVSEPVDTPT